MNRDDIIRMAREAGFRAGHIELYNSDPMPFVAPCSATDCLPEIERFAAIVAGSAAAKIEALRARIAEMDRQEPIGWFTEDHLTDRSATTYDAATASRWAEKGWPVGRLYAGPGAQPRPAELAAAAEDDDLYWRLHAVSKSLEGAGRLDEHENPDAYATVLDAMAFVQQREACATPPDRAKWYFKQVEPSGTVVARAPDGKEFAVKDGDFNSSAGRDLLNAMIAALSGS